MDGKIIPLKHDFSAKCICLRCSRGEAVIFIEAVAMINAINNSTRAVFLDRVKSRLLSHRQASDIRHKTWKMHCTEVGAGKKKKMRGGKRSLMSRRKEKKIVTIEFSH